MNKFNSFGMEMLEFKKELLNKNYPEIVRKSLYIAVDQFAKNDSFDVDIDYALKDDNMDVDEFKMFMLNKPTCLKTKEELLGEYEVLRHSLCSMLEGFQLPENIESESNTEKETVTFKQTFSLNSQFAIDYFGIKEDELERMMKTKGFISKFAVLRLTKVMRDFMESAQIPEELEHEASMVLFDLEECAYFIQYILHIPIEKLEEESNIENIAKDISNHLTFLDEYFKERFLV